MLRRHCQQVFVCGLSMGGLLALLLAASEQVDGLVVMAAPVQSAQNRIMNLATLLKYIRPYFDGSDKSDFPQRLIEEQKRRGEEARGRVRYDRWAYSGVDALYKLMKTVDMHLPGVQEPTLLMYSTADPTVPYSNLAYIQQRIGSTVVETATFERSGHILTQDVDHMAVCQRAGDFIEQQAALTIINR